jgi:hypothetical protein
MFEVIGEDKESELAVRLPPSEELGMKRGSQAEAVCRSFEQRSKKTTLLNFFGIWQR